MITLQGLIGINKVICEDCNQTSVMINENNLLSALSVQQWYEKDLLLASALIRSLVIAHGFQDGNKRTSTIIGMMIKDFECTEDELIQVIIDIATGKLKDVEDIADILYNIRR